MGFSFVVKKTPAPPAAQWYSVLDNTYWSVSFPGASWDGSKWSNPIAATLPLTELGTWVEGYRPTKIRVTASGGGNLQMQLNDGSTNIINENPYTSGTELDITFDGNDIASLTVSADSAPLEITNIEFYSEADPTA